MVMPLCCGSSNCCAQDTHFKVSLPALTISTSTFDLGGGSATPGTAFGALTNGDPGTLSVDCNKTAFAGQFMNTGSLSSEDTWYVHYDMWYVGKRLYAAIWSGEMTGGYTTTEPGTDEDGNPIDVEVSHDPVAWPYTKGMILFYGYVDLDSCCQRTATITNMLGSVGSTFAATGMVARDCIVAASGGPMTVKTFCNSCLTCGVTQPDATVSHSGSVPIYAPTGVYTWSSYSSPESLGTPGFCRWVWSKTGAGGPDGVVRTYWLVMLFDITFNTWTTHIGDALDGGNPDHGTYGPFPGASPDDVECVDGILTSTFTLNDSTSSPAPNGGIMTVATG
jgi:hypothetical protein